MGDNIFVVILLFIVGIVFIVKGGDWFVDSAGGIAEASGIPKFIVGATIVSMATTLPELIVSVFAAIDGEVEMAIGNAVGSVTANTGLILALSLIFIPMAMKRKMFMTKGILLLVTMAVLLVFSLSGNLGIAGVVVLFALFAFFIYENVKDAKNSQSQEERVVFTKNDWIKNIAFFIAGTIGIVIGSRLLVDNGVILAELAGIPKNIIALTMIAIGTSLPELVTAITAIVKKQGSLSVGNIIGANIIDSALILPICALIGGGSLPVAASTLYLDMPVSLLIGAVALVPAFISQKFSRWQGITMMILYIAYLVVLTTGIIAF